ncbi:MAG: CRISPR-associated ring nuclease, partial [Pseudomonadota bacterium]|nr:CRISPR-associated ring nuclease [Pseudomonadota bacterium]
MENILIATLGLEYKVLISALKSFVVDKNIKINKVYVITSHKGKEIIKENLLDNGEFKKFKNAYKLLDIEFDESNILVPKNDKNEYLTGIFTETDNKLFLRECFKITKKFIKTNNIISFLVTGGMK